MAKKVLVVDDEKLIVKGIRFSLEQDGMEVTCAYDGEEALLCAKEQKFDMILLDIMLPKLSGTEVCQQIREFSDVPIVMLTAKNDDMDKIMGLEYGADDYITKPFNILAENNFWFMILTNAGNVQKQSSPTGSVVVVLKALFMPGLAECLARKSGQTYIKRRYVLFGNFGNIPRNIKIIGKICHICSLGVYIPFTDKHGFYAVRTKSFVKAHANSAYAGKQIY